MVILGLDPGTAITGFGLLRVEQGRTTVMDYGTLETKKGPSDAARLMHVYDEAEDLLRRAKPDAIAIEHLFFGRNVNTMLSVGRASGVLLLAAAKAGIEIAEYTPMQVKMAVVGVGNAEKKQVQYMVSRILSLKETPKPDDVADALALAICHAHSYKINAYNPRASVAGSDARAGDHPMRLLAGLAALFLTAGARGAVKPFVFAHISDTHMAAEHPERDVVLKAALREIEAANPRPDLIIHTGDITDMGRAADFSRYKRNVSSVGLPLYHSPGNHETRWADQSINRYRAELGSTNVSFLHNGVRFIGFSAAIWLAHQGAVSGDTRRWIVSELKKDPKGTPAVLFCHQPPFYPSSVQQTGDTELWQAIAPFNVRLFIAGHVHAMRSWWRNGIFLHTTKAMMNDDGYYSLIEVSQDAIRVDEVKMGPEGGRKTVATIPLHADPLRVAIRSLGPDKAVPSRRYFTATLSGPRDRTRSVRAVQWTVDDHDRPGAQDWTKLDPTGPGRYAFTVDTSRLTPGNHRLTVRATDADGRPWLEVVDLPVSANGFETAVFQAGTALQAPAAADAEAAYVGGWDGRLYAVDARAMTPRWTFQTQGAIIGQAAVDDRAVYFGSTDRNVYAVNKQTGKQIWKYPTGGPIQGHVRLANGTVFVSSGDHNLYAIDAATGAERWVRTLGMHAQARPAVADGMVYIGAWDQTFYALDERTGKTVWTRQTAGPNMMYSPAISSPLAVGGKVVFTYPVPGGFPDAPQVLCVDGRTGETLWGARAPESTYSDTSPTSDGKNVYLSAIKGEVHALDLETGRPVWTSPLPDTVHDGAAVVHNGQVVANTLLGGLEAFDAETGRRLWSWKTGDGFQFSWPTPAAGTVWQTSMDGTLTRVTLPAS